MGVGEAVVVVAMVEDGASDEVEVTVMMLVMSPSVVTVTIVDDGGSLVVGGSEVDVSGDVVVVVEVVGSLVSVGVVVVEVEVGVSLDDGVDVSVGVSVGGLDSEELLLVGSGTGTESVGSGTSLVLDEGSSGMEGDSVGDGSGMSDIVEAGDVVLTLGSCLRSRKNMLAGGLWGVKA